MVSRPGVVSGPLVMSQWVDLKKFEKVVRAKEAEGGLLSFLESSPVETQVDDGKVKSP